MLLAGDIGGTKAALAIFSSEGGPRAPLAQAEYQSGDYPALAAIVRTFLGHTDLRVDRACFAVAGPVLGGRAHVTNLPWVLDEAALAREIGVPVVRLLNDLEALARAIPLLEPDDLHTLNTGEVDPGGTIAVIAPGTGLGEAFLTRDGARYRAHPSEGGHADFAPTDGRQIGLLEYMLRHSDHVSYEHVCSGIGIPNIYAYLRERGCEPECPAITQGLAGAAEPAKVICEAALDPASPDALCAATLDLFLAILGAEAGNLALKVLATGGVYLGGGIPMHIAPALGRGAFMASFRAKGRFAELLGRVPVHLIVRQAALIGAAECGLREATGQ
jgi:glucokinase